MPPARVRSVTAPAAALRSMSSCTRAACAAGRPTIRPTTPAGAITAMFVSTPSALPRSMVTVRMPGFGLPAMTSAASVGSAVLAFRSSSAWSCSDRRASARCSCSRTSSAATWLLQRLVLRPRAAQRDVVAPRTSVRRAARSRSPPWTRANSPNVTASSIGTPDFDCTCAEIRKMCPSVTTNSSTPVRRRISNKAPVSSSRCPVLLRQWARPRSPSRSRSSAAG